jgi:hypothetical protein
MCYRRLLFLVIILAASRLWAGDPRIEKDEVRGCFENAQHFMSSSDYSGAKNEGEVLGACRDVDPDCVEEVGNSYHPSDSFKRADFLKLIKACRGRGMGKCFRAQRESIASYNRREAGQILELLKKCE